MNDKTIKSLLDLKKLTICACQGKPLSDQDQNKLKKAQEECQDAEWIEEFEKNANSALKDINLESTIVMMIKMIRGQSEHNHKIDSLKDALVQITNAIGFLGNRVKELDENYDKVLHTMDIVIGKKETKGDRKCQPKKPIKN